MCDDDIGALNRDMQSADVDRGSLGGRDERVTGASELARASYAAASSNAPAPRPRSSAAAPGPAAAATIEQAVRASVIPRLYLSFGVEAPTRRRHAQAADVQSAAATADLDGFFETLLHGSAEDLRVALSGAARRVGPVDLARAGLIDQRGVGGGAAASTPSAAARMLALEPQFIQPAAARLGALWVQDVCSFTDVTLAMDRLDRVLLQLFDEARRRDGAPVAGPSRRSLLLGAASNTGHRLGLRLVAERFRLDGWRVEGGGALQGDALIAAAAAAPYDVVGLSIGCEVAINPTARLIRALRLRSANRGAAVLVGGAAVTDDPSLGRRVGADVAAACPSKMLRLAELALDVLSVP